MSICRLVLLGDLEPGLCTPRVHCTSFFFSYLFCSYKRFSSKIGFFSQLTYSKNKIFIVKNMLD